MRQRKKRIFFLAAVIISIIIIIGFVIFKTDIFMPKFSEKVIKIDGIRNQLNQLNNVGCKIKDGKFNKEECTKGANGIQPRFALVGDSHGESLSSELEKAFKKNNSSFIPFVRSGCPLNFYMDDSFNNVNKECKLYQESIRKELKELKNIDTWIVISRRDGYFDVQGKKNFQLHIRSIKEILSQGKRVILVYPIPVFEKNISDYMANNLMFYNGKLNLISINSSEFSNRIKYFYDGFDSIDGSGQLFRIRSDQIFCNSFEQFHCSSQRDGIPLYIDNSHLSNEGARLVVDSIIKVINF